MTELKKTVFFDRHVSLNAKMVDFGGWQMPIQYPTGIVEEHLATRKRAGIFDVSHMGRFVFRGKNTVPFLQYVLTNNAAAIDVCQAQYTIISNDNGGAIDDAYLYRFTQDEYILVVNASNAQKDWDYFQGIIKKFSDIEMINKTEEIAMVSLQGPQSRSILNEIIESGTFPEPLRNRLSIAVIAGTKVLLGRTGYTGEPVCFELFVDRRNAIKIWNLLINKGAVPVGLGARDTLRTEAGLPLYGHEFGTDADGNEIPIFACPLARVAVSFSPIKGDFVGKQALKQQFESLKKIAERDYTSTQNLPRIIMPVALIDKGVARAQCKVFSGDKLVGYVTSGTTVPYWKFDGEGILSRPTDEKSIRSICLAILDNTFNEGDEIEIEIRDKRVKAVIVPMHLSSETPIYARPVLAELLNKHTVSADKDTYPEKVVSLLNKTIENTAWRQKECINLIPSEQTLSPMTRLLSIMDPAFRYGEHKRATALHDLDIFYYQGIDFINEVEQLLEKEMCKYLGCSDVETRLISGQMANMAVFSAVVDYINRMDRKKEQRKIRCVLNNHIIKGGHLSAQPMGALQDFVARDPRTEKLAVVNFPVLPDNPYKIDVAECKKIIAEYKPELIIFGKSVVLHPEPVKEISKFVTESNINCYIMYDMAHVLGLVGPHFQEPFKDGADIVTASTHKTFFGTQRGIAASNYAQHDQRYKFWETIKKRTFPGYTSNHHLGTLLGLLMATYEMNCFKDEYQKKVIANAKSFAKSLNETGMKVDGDPMVSYTETHQVILNIGYGKGPEIAKRLEENNIIVNYQATAGEEGFTASGSLRLGVSEMTRFGMEEKDFRTVAQLMHDVIMKNKPVKEEIKSFRNKFIVPKFCFSGKEFDIMMEKLHKLL